MSFSFEAAGQARALLVASEVCALFLVMLAGWLAARLGRLPGETQARLAWVVMFVTLPALILAAFHIELPPDIAVEAGKILAFSLAVHGLSALASGPLTRDLEPAGSTGRASARFALTFANGAFMGFPVLAAVLGKTGVMLGAVYSIGFNVLFWTFGPALFSSAFDLRTFVRNLLNPSMAAILFGAVLWSLELRLPAFALKACETLGSATTPLAMLLVGAMLAEARTPDLLGDKTTWRVALVRLALVPAVTWLALLAAGQMNSPAAKVCVLVSAMPTAVNTAVMVKAFGHDAGLASRCVFLTTVVCVLTVPLWAAIAG